MDDLKEYYCKAILFQMWQRIESNQFNARSFVGDMSLELRGILFENDEHFWKEYDTWKKKHNNRVESDR